MSQEAIGSTEPKTEKSEKPVTASASTRRAATTAHAAKSSAAFKNEEPPLTSGTDSSAGLESGAPGENEDAPVSALDTFNENEGPETAEQFTPENGSKELADAHSPSLSDSGESASGFQNASNEEQGCLPLQETDSLLSPVGGGINQDDGYQGSGYGGAASDIERLLDNMAEKAVNISIENERLSELNELAQNISYGDIHGGVKITVHRITEVGDEMKEQYREASGSLLHISRHLQRSISQQLRDKRRGGKQTGLLMGRRLDAHALPRNDARIFYKNSLPSEAPEMAIALLNDESGSMESCDRATYARAASIILYDFCRALKIPVMIYGHSTDSGVDLYSYAEFDDIGRDDCVRLMDISARSSNRDGAALRFVAEQLIKRPEEVKILILISDGQPADSGYYGSAAEEDLRGIKYEYSRKGVIFVAAAIGDDKDDIERIYGNSFLDITDMNKLPAALTTVIKRHMRM
jgi:cobalamin biosynthesis protein CobT